MNILDAFWALFVAIVAPVHLTYSQTIMSNQFNSGTLDHNQAPPHGLTTAGELVVPQTSTICSREGLNRIVGDCRHYHNCVAISGYYRVYTYQCPLGTVFDQIQGTCTPSDNVEGCRPNVTDILPPVPPSASIEDKPEVEMEKELEPASDINSGDLEPDSDEAFGIRKPIPADKVVEKDLTTNTANTVVNQFWTRDYKCPATNYQRHPKFCNQYYSCERSNVNNVFVLSVFYCPVPLVFDDKKQVCDWPKNVADCTIFSPIQPTIPVGHPPTQEMPPEGANLPEDNLQPDLLPDAIPVISAPEPPKRVIIKPSRPTQASGSIDLNPPFQAENQLIGTQELVGRPGIEIIIPPSGLPIIIPSNKPGSSGSSGIKGGVKGGASSIYKPFWQMTSTTTTTTSTTTSKPQTPSRPPVKGKHKKTWTTTTTTTTTTTPAPPVKGKPKPTTTTTTTTTTPAPPIKGKPKPTTTTTIYPTKSTTPRPTTKPTYKPAIEPQYPDPEDPLPPPEQQPLPPTEQQPLPPPEQQPLPPPPEQPNPPPVTEEPEIDPTPETERPEPPQEPKPVCESEGQYFIDVSDCSKFFRCSNGIVVQFSCPNGLMFDPLLNICNWPQDVSHPCGRPRRSFGPFARSINSDRSMRRKAKNKETVTQSQYFWIRNGRNIQSIPFRPQRRVAQPQKRLAQTQRRIAPPQSRVSYQRLYYDPTGNRVIISPQNRNSRQ